MLETTEKDLISLVGAKIEALMVARGWRAPYIVSETGISQTSLYRIINKEKGPTFDELVKLSKIFSTPIYEFFITDEERIKAGAKYGIPRELLQRLAVADQDELSDIARLFRVNDEVDRESLKPDLSKHDRKKG